MCKLHPCHDVVMNCLWLLCNILLFAVIDSTKWSAYVLHWAIVETPQVSFYTPAPPKVEWGYTGFTPMSVRPSVRLSVDKVSGTFWKTIGSIHFIPGIYPYGVSLLTLFHLRVPSLIFGPLAAKYFAENWVSGIFFKNCWPNSFHTLHLPLWGESLDPSAFSCSLASFSALW